MNYSYEGPEHTLRVAAREGDTDTVRAMLDQGADANAFPRQGLSALTLAVRGMHLETVRLLLERGADVKHLAPVSGYFDSPAMRRLLAEYGYIVDVKSEDGGYTLIKAASEGGTAAIEWLLPHSVNVRSDNGDYALMAAALEGQATAVELLLRHGADARARDDKGANALDHALKGLAEWEARKDAATPEEMLSRTGNYYETIRLLMKQ